MLFVLSCKTWNVAGAWGLVGAWLARPPLGVQGPQDSSLILSKVLQVLHSQQAVTHSQGSVEARSKAQRPALLCFLSLNKMIYLISLTIDNV